VALFAVAAAGCPLPVAGLQAQEPVLLRLKPASNEVQRFRADMDVWLSTPLLAQADTTIPTVHIVSYQTRILTSPDSSHIELTDHTDSSRFDFPGFAGMVPAGTDALRGMRTLTRMDARGRNMTTMLITAPNLPPGMPSLVRGVQGLIIGIARMATISLAERPVAPGDSWTDSLNFDLANIPGQDVALQGSGSGTATIRLERIEQQPGRRVAVLRAFVTATAGGGDAGAAATLNIGATSTLAFDIDAGRFIRSETRLEGPLITRMGMIPVRLHAVLQLQ
jgi:hypothetical protein